jgi:hypothetical protein
MGRGGCSKLIDDQRRCIVDARTDATYACLGKTSPEAGPKDPAQMKGDNPAWADLEYSGYWPLAAFIGTDKNRFGFEGDEPLLGASAADVRKCFKYRVDRGRIRLWPIETSRTSWLPGIAEDRAPAPGDVADDVAMDGVELPLDLRPIP